VRAAYHGQVQLHPDAAQRLMNAIAANSPRAQPVQEHLPDALTDRELETLRLIASGLSNREIAERLVISEKTVKTHVSNILSKLGLEDRTQAAIYALKHGLSAD
jgi:DNA-binding NarL/FixJ family response regulator